MTTAGTTSRFTPLTLRSSFHPFNNPNRFFPFTYSRIDHAFSRVTVCRGTSRRCTVPAYLCCCACFFLACEEYRGGSRCIRRCRRLAPCVQHSDKGWLPRDTGATTADIV